MNDIPVMTSDPTARLAEFLAIGDTSRNLPGVAIKDAAAMLVIDRTGPAAKVLLGRRHHGHKFMPGKFVFPGGRVEPADRRMSAATPLDARVMARLMVEVRNPSPQKARGFALAAVRETFEETGLLLGLSRGAATGEARRLSGSASRPGATGAPPAPSLPGARGAPPAPSPLSQEWAKFVALGVVPDLAALHFIARAITPPGRPRRFDTRFFAVDAGTIAARIEGVVGPDTELVELVWLPIEDTSKLDMPGITMAVLEELRIRTEGGFTHDLPVPFYRIHRGKRLREFLS